MLYAKAQALLRRAKGLTQGDVLAAGALASARLWLGCHTIRQVAAGYVGGFIVATLAVLLL